MRKLQAILAALLVSMMPGLPAAEIDYAQDVEITGDPSPINLRTGSSLNQFGRGQTDSQIDNYLHQDEQINLTERSGQVRVLRTNQKAVVNDFVTAMIPLHNVNPRELRGLARTITRKEGGDADVLQDKESGINYLVVVCPEFQLPFITRTLQALDYSWVREFADGSYSVYYKGQHRNVRDIMNILQVYRSPDGVWEFDDSNNAVIFLDQPNVAGLFQWGTETVDIPPSQLTLDVAIYEVDTRNDLVLGVDWEGLRNGPSHELFEFIFWDFGGDAELGLFPGQPDIVSDHGRYRSYNAAATTAWLDFLQSKGMARLMTQATLSARSGSVAELAAVDRVLTFTSSSATPTDLTRPVPMRLSEVWDYYYGRGQVELSLDQLLAQDAASVIGDVNAFLANIVGVSAGARQATVDALLARSEEGTLTRDALSTIYVAPEVTLQVFRDRTVEYLKTGQVGVLLTIMPVVGLESAEVTLSIDVSDVADIAPNGMPMIQHRFFSSVVQLEDGKPLVLSGFTRKSDVKTKLGVPYLMDIPLLGYAFGREVRVKREREVVVVLTPRFELCPTDEPAPPAELVTALRLAKGEDVLDVPPTVFGFDQWLLDPARR